MRSSNPSNYRGDPYSNRTHGASQQCLAGFSGISNGDQAYLRCTNKLIFYVGIKLTYFVNKNIGSPTSSS
jgi:hypothetical protein